MKKMDYALFISFIFLTFIGLLMVYSSSRVVALFKYNDQFYYLKKELIFVLIGAFVMIILLKININLLYKVTTYIYLFIFVCLILVLIPGIGLERGGARSWIGFGAFSFQPAEFMKLALVLLLAKYLSKNDQDLKSFFSFFSILLIIFISFGLIMLEPDFGTGIVIVISSIILLFASGAPLKYFLFLFLIAIFGLGFLILSAPYRLERIVTFFNPYSDPLGSGFQIIQSLYAISPSGIFGLGFDSSMQKHFFLPEPQNDFIFAIISEEFGLIGALIVIALFAFMIYRILIISKNAQNKYHRYLTLGIACLYFTQVFINIGVVIGLLPVTGITLPIISYGGSSLLLSVVLISIVLNISKYKE